MAPRIYHLHPLVAGKLADWSKHFARCRAMGFDIVCVAPPFAPGQGGDIFITADYERLHPALGWEGSADEGLTRVAKLASEHGLRLWLDLTIDQVAADAGIRQQQPLWFTSGDFAGPTTPWRAPQRHDVAYARLDQTDIAEAMGTWWLDRLGRLTQAGIAGFRCLAPHRTPASFWRRAIEALKQHAECRFLAWTPAIERPLLPRLAGVGFDQVCCSLGWWDGRAHWLVEEYEILRRIAPVLASPEPSFHERLVNRLPPDADIATAYRLSLRLAAAVGSGMLIPMGFEYAARPGFDSVVAGPDDFRRIQDEAPCDLAAEIAAANSLVNDDTDGGMRQLTGTLDTVTALLKTDASDPRFASRGVLVLANPDIKRSAAISLPLSPLPPQAGVALVLADSTNEADGPLGAGEVRVLPYAPTEPVRYPAMRDSDLRGSELAQSRVVIEAVRPAAGAYPVKRVVGESIVVSADIFADGHDVLAAELLWRPMDAAEWQRVTMRLIENDRWEAAFTPARIGRHEFTVQAWWDAWATFRHDMTAKHHAGQNVMLEIEEGHRMIRAAAGRAANCRRTALSALADRLGALDCEQQIEQLLSAETAVAMQAADERRFLAQHEIAIKVDVDRPQGMFASWYELFPRSVTDSPHRHGTFRDVIERLPAIRTMGFDVLYFPPIHPIGTTNRKGRNNALRAEPDDVGSPYAIGGPAGGHDAIHPQLGTLEDFRALLDAAKDNGLEIALDFAIQCSPDHPWLREHPDWFRWRPDGSIRFAENPPKKYEDIVNPDFYADTAMPALWFALRDVVQFWVDQGVRIFRVDNPHTKPLPFWQWMIADIRGRHPDVLFLAEAFTRPKMMYQLAKVGFSQSYTYFTWRNTKQELTEYLTELNEPPVRDFFRPNFFVNTPDINPPFLQTSGRAGFLIRAALASTLSGLWGMYSGFEICEAAPLPGREEYLDSEKYQIRVRDFAEPGNIVAEITALNRIRREQPALQTHLGLTFYPAFNDQILLYGKRAEGAHEMILVAVSLDPHNVQEAAIEVPLWEWDLPDHATLAAMDLVRGHRFVWTGKQQRIRLDPADMPFAIWQVAPQGAL